MKRFIIVNPVLITKILIIVPAQSAGRNLIDELGGGVSEIC